MGTQRKQNFRALQAFEAVSRHMSVSAAAVELGVTQSAVSHQIRLLTEEMGERLLQKQGRGVALTAAGDRLASRLQVAFADIARSVMETIGTARTTVRLAVCSSFAPGWLIPRLSRLYAHNPSFDLQLCMYAQDPILTDTVADAFITSMTPETGFYSLLLKKEMLVPVASPAHISRFGGGGGLEPVPAAGRAGFDRASREPLVVCLALHHCSRHGPGGAWGSTCSGFSCRSALGQWRARPAGPGYPADGQ